MVIISNVVTKNALGFPQNKKNEQKRRALSSLTNFEIQGKKHSFEPKIGPKAIVV